MKASVLALVLLCAAGTSDRPDSHALHRPGSTAEGTSSSASRRCLN